MEGWCFSKIAPSFGTMGVFIPIASSHINMHVLLESAIPNLYTGVFFGLGLPVLITGVIGFEISYDIGPFLCLNCNIAWLSIKNGDIIRENLDNYAIMLNPGITWLVFRWGEPGKEYDGIFISINKGFELYKNIGNATDFFHYFYMFNIEIGFFSKDL